MEGANNPFPLSSSLTPDLPQLVEINLRVGWSVTMVLHEPQLKITSGTGQENTADFPMIPLLRSIRTVVKATA
jgi:hypothetical protein